MNKKRLCSSKHTSSTSLEALGSSIAHLSKQHGNKKHHCTFIHSRLLHISSSFTRYIFTPLVTTQKFPPRHNKYLCQVTTPYSSRQQDDKRQHFSYTLRSSIDLFSYIQYIFKLPYQHSTMIFC